VRYCECGKVIKDTEELLCLTCLAEKMNLHVEGYLYKKQQFTKLKKFWFALENKELYCEIRVLM
jgi:hypothetical protein